jgi:hypothetical protein
MNTRLKIYTVYIRRLHVVQFEPVSTSFYMGQDFASSIIPPSYKDELEKFTNSRLVHLEDIDVYVDPRVSGFRLNVLIPESSPYFNYDFIDRTSQVRYLGLSKKIYEGNRLNNLGDYLHNHIVKNAIVKSKLYHV